MEKSRRLFYPDFIRVAALFCVLIYHFQVEARRWTGAFQGIPRLESGIHGIDIGQIGVSLYFILSGASLMISKKPFHTVAFFDLGQGFSIFQTARGRPSRTVL